MDLYAIRRRRAWLSREEFDAVAACVPAVNAKLREHVRWIRSYIVPEDDGSLGAVCLYEATSRDALREHAEALRLPTDEIHMVAETLVAAPDPPPLAVTPAG